MKASLICPVCGRGRGDPRPPCPACPDAPQSRRAPELPAAASGEEQPRVVNAEVLGPETASHEHTQDSNRHHRHDGTFGNKAHGPESHNVFGDGSMRFGHIWSTGRAEQNACLAPCISFVLFLVCLVQFGVLAGIGFVFFHLLGSVAGSLREMRQLMLGRKPNPWVWRIGNWFVSFLLVAWLSGGFD
ncbi:hypothetical protein [Desulfovibrio sp. ZJ200]|uniref:hypothetical protein n=1 Tax=Desulfovibrio sp. ZJ200 TaxID=2709792 RepID=UPI001F14F8B1|nr:hypothetical protein [Desulfovibrio sp. ZJ200]